MTARSQIAVPAAACRLGGLTAGSTVVPFAFTTRQVLVVHTAADVLRLLHRIHPRIVGRPA